MQFKINSTINSQKGKLKDRLVASERKEIKKNVAIAFSNFLATTQIKPIPKELH